ncbi:MAG: IPT/TIG domain-containing protein [Solirubrobacterales bacterium]
MGGLAQYSGRDSRRGGFALLLAATATALLLAPAAPASAAPSTGMAWGSGYGDVPATISGLSGVTAVSIGGLSSDALLSNGTVVEWAPGIPFPAPVSGLSEVTAVSAGDGYSLALLTNGKVMAWGEENTYGALGDGTTEESATPVEVSGLTDVTAISAGPENSLALRQDGTVVAWGRNDVGQLGNGSTSGPQTCSIYNQACSTTPVAVSGLSAVTAISAGYEDGLAVESDGTVKAWGGNGRGQLGQGNGDLELHDEPVPVGGLTEVTAVAAGLYHNLALRSDSTVRSWGENSYGELGAGWSHEGPWGFVEEVKGLSGVTAIAAGDGFSLALMSSGTVQAWGSNSLGQLGIGTSEGPEECLPTTHECSRLPVTVSGLSGVDGIAAGLEDRSAAFGAFASSVTAISPNAGPGAGGTSVTISGASLGEATAVHFGATEATSVTVNSPTSITAISPPGTGTVDVTVTTPEGSTPVSEADRFNYQPAVTSISPNRGVEAGGTAITIAGTNFNEVAAVEFGSTAAVSWKVNSPTSLTAEAPPGTGVVDVTVVSSGGTSATSSADRFTYVPAPTVLGLEPTTGPTGARVTINGTNLNDVLAVKFGSASASGIQVRDPGSSISAEAPSGAGTTDVTVTTPGGTSATSPSDRFTYLPSATVTKIKPTKGPVSGETPVTISGTHLSEATAVRFGATSAKGFTINTIKGVVSITAVSPAASAGTVDVTVTTPGGTSPIVSKDRFKFLPVVTGVSPNTGSKAGGESVTVSGSGFAPGFSSTVFKFGTTKAKAVSCSSSTTCVMTVPAHAVGTVDVKATVNKASSVASAPADQFTYG